jgi:hypothetical membrane protein
MTIIKYDFLLQLGWHPINTPTFDWPSGLALGPYGWVMTITFIVSGGLMIMLAANLFWELALIPAAKLGSTFLALSGFFLACLAFTTDPTIRNTPATWHGNLHDLSFICLGLTLFPAMLVLGFAFYNAPRWKSLSLYTWLTVFLIAPTFYLKGAAFYIFLLFILGWNEVLALHLNKRF